MVTETQKNILFPYQFLISDKPITNVLKIYSPSHMWIHVPSFLEGEEEGETLIIPTSTTQITPTQQFSSSKGKKIFHIVTTSSFYTKMKTKLQIFSQIQHSKILHQGFLPQAAHMSKLQIFGNHKLWMEIKFHYS